MSTEDFNRRIIEEFRANSGRVGGPLAGTPILLLHHVGAHSGRERVTPLAYTPEGDGRYLIVASNGGAPTHPGWYHNLKANPVVEVEVGSETFLARAEELSGARRASRWPRLVAASPSLRAYQAETRRRIPIFLLAAAPGPLDANRREHDRPAAPKAGDPDERRDRDALHPARRERRLDLVLELARGRM